MRADRLLSIMLLLQVHRRMTARDLARRLEVSERTIHRDMEALSASGVPVVAERGAAGGWMLPDGYQTTLTGLTPAEIQALFLAQPAALVADLGLTQAAAGARIKLQAALPAAFREDAEYVRQRIYVDTGGWKQPGGGGAPLLPVVQDALFAGHKLAMTYQKSDGSASERVVDPLGLVAKGSIWYLLAATPEGERRTFRVSRVVEARVLEEPALRPAGFDLEAAWHETKETFVAALPQLRFTVRVAPEAVRRVRAGNWTRVERVDGPGPDGWSTVALLTETEEEASAFVLAFGAQMEVLEPLTLRQRVIDQARAVLLAHGARP